MIHQALYRDNYKAMNDLICLSLSLERKKNIKNTIIEMII